MTEEEALRDYLLAFADDEHFIGQHHTEWIGVAPFLEEDLALSSIGQDELGHAVMLYELVLDLDNIEATDGAIDQLAYRRTGDQYRSCALAEYRTDDWAQTLVRHWIYDMVEELRWGLVAQSSHRGLLQTSARAGREELFHRRHADAMVDSLLQSRHGAGRLLDGLSVILPMVPSILEPVAGEELVIAAGVASGSLHAMAPEIGARIDARFGVTTATEALTSGLGLDIDRTSRTPDFQPMMTRMLEVLDYDPTATW